MHHITNDTLHHDFNVPYVRKEIKRVSQRYADKIEYPNIFTTNLMRSIKIPNSFLKRRSQNLCA